MELNKKVAKVIKMLSANNLKIAFAESVTGGYLSYQYSIAEGSGNVFLGSMVCYDSVLKQKLLQVDPKLINKYTADSQEVTEKMLDGLMHIVHPDIGVAVTGLCSPGGSETQKKPVGNVFFAISYNLETFHYKFENTGSPEKIVHQTVDEISEAIIDLLSPVNA